ELNVRLGQKAGGKEAVELVPDEKRPSPLADKVRVSGDTATLDLGITRIDLRTGGNQPNGAPLALPENFLKREYQAQFKAADTDNNGYLDMKEAEANPLFRNTFKLMDRDGDGKLFEKEMVAYLDSVQEFQNRAAQCCVTLNVTDGGRGLFDLLDTN